MGLLIVPLQLYLPGMSLTPEPVTGSEDSLDHFRAHRDGQSWLKSAISYCEWRAARSLRPHRDRAERAARAEYLDAIRLLHQLLYSRPAEPTAPQLMLPAVDLAEPGYTPEEMKLAALPTAWLVDELMRTDRRYTLRRSLMHLRRLKLARLLVRARAEAAAAMPERRLA